MNKNNKLYIDPAMFTKPPPNFKKVNLVQPFKPDVPPPPYVKHSSQVALSNPGSNGNFSNNDDDNNYYLMMLYRYHNSTNTPQSSHHQNSFPTANPSKSFPLPPPTHFSQQPPLPAVPPPQNPPPPPPTLPPSASMAMGNYHNRISAMYNHSYPKMHNNFKRKFEGNDTQKKLQKKKKKPLSQVVPQRRDWTMEEAKRALCMERDCNKRSKRQGLIIKFPDLELNRDIVSNFHTSIESVHFQQPSTARYCFVTLTESADPETVINQLNKIPFGLGYLSAEFKKDREDEQNIKPTDIDPLTLYVGNLAQEVTKDDMEKKYPKRKRIDIGYAKKMKYTRYAFVSFYTVNDAIEAFQNTHSSQMYSKSLIVRFRRLHGTVGMPGEPKQGNQRFEIGNSFNILENSNYSVGRQNQWDIDISHWDNDTQDIKCKRSDIPTSEDDESEEVEFKPPRSTNYENAFKPGSVQIAFSLHKPRIIKEECEDNQYDSSYNPDEDYDINEYDGNTNILNPRYSNNYQLNTTKDAPTDTGLEIASVTIKKENCNNSAPPQSSAITYDYLKKVHDQIRSGNAPIPFNNKSRNHVEIKQENEYVETENKQEANLNRLLPENDNILNQDVNNQSSNIQNTNDTELLKDCSVNNDSLSETTAKTTADGTNNNCFDWMNKDYTSTVIKTETFDSEQR